MAPLDSKKTYNALLSKGFQKSTHGSVDHKRLEFWYNGKLTRCRTMFSHNGQEINDYLAGQMARQICLTKKQFTEFASCTLTEAQYIAILKEQNLV